MSEQSGMSKKAAVACTAMATIAASSDWRTQAIIAGVSGVAIIAQAVLDWRKK